MLSDISIIPQISEELAYFVEKEILYLCGFWRFANVGITGFVKGDIGDASYYNKKVWADQGDGY